MKNGFDADRYILIDKSTGEEVNVQIFLEQTKQSGWEKAYAGLLAEYVGLGGNATATVLAYLIKERTGANLVLGTQEEIRNATGVSIQTVKTIFRTLTKKGMLKKIRNGTYMLTPLMLRNGDNQKGAMLLRIWSEA